MRSLDAPHHRTATSRVFAVALTLGTVLLAGCASDPAIAAAERQREQQLFVELTTLGLRTSEPARRLPRHRIHGWQAVDDRNVILLLGVDERVLVRLASSCGDLDRAVALRFRTDALGTDPIDRRHRLHRDASPVVAIGALGQLPQPLGRVPVAGGGQRDEVVTLAHRVHPRTPRTAQRAIGLASRRWMVSFLIPALARSSRRSWCEIGCPARAAPASGVSRP